MQPVVAARNATPRGDYWLAPLAINRRGLHLRQVEAFRCAVALSVDVHSLCLRAFRRDQRWHADNVFLSSRHSLELRILLDCQRAVIDIALDHSGAVQLDAVGMDRPLDATADR